jgi:predicted TIM-barrel fold metal-dependent hydrolase
MTNPRSQDKDREVWDCHVHVIGDQHRWPLASTRTYDPPLATPDVLEEHLASIGADRAVIVQPSVYGFDNSCLLDALAQSEGRWRGVAVPAPRTTHDLLAEMHAAGVRAVRCNLLNTGGITIEDCQPWWDWMQQHGWHLQLQMDATRTDFLATINQIPVPLVIDHMGFPGADAPFSRLAPLLAAVGKGCVYVKLSAQYRISKQPPPHGDAVDLAAALLAANPSACLFATDWPHTDHTGPRSDDKAWMAQVRHSAADDWDKVCKAASRLFAA